MTNDDSSWKLTEKQQYRPGGNKSQQPCEYVTVQVLGLLSSGDVTPSDTDRETIVSEDIEDMLG